MGYCGWQTTVVLIVHRTPRSFTHLLSRCSPFSERVCNFKPINSTTKNGPLRTSSWVSKCMEIRCFGCWCTDHICRCEGQPSPTHSYLCLQYYNDEVIVPSPSASVTLSDGSWPAQSVRVYRSWFPFCVLVALANNHVLAQLYTTIVSFLDMLGRLTQASNRLAVGCPLPFRVGRTFLYNTFPPRKLRCFLTRLLVRPSLHLHPSQTSLRSLNIPSLLSIAHLPVLLNILPAHSTPVQ
jgi:hypothetical protein